MALSCGLSNFMRKVSLLTILCKMLAVFVTLACMLGGARLYVGCGIFVCWTRPVMYDGQDPVCMLGGLV